MLERLDGWGRGVLILLEALLLIDCNVCLGDLAIRLIAISYPSAVCYDQLLGARHFVYYNQLVGACHTLKSYHNKFYGVIFGHMVFY